MTASPDGDGPRLPDFFVVGHHKSGTTALYEMLRAHPQVFMPELKEPRYFATDLRALVPSTPLQPDTFEEYVALFADARPDQRVGEASPSYLRSATAAAEIAAVCPDARIIAILREPASFVRSMHLQLLQEHVETEPDLARAFAGEEVRRGEQTVLRYSDHVHYVAQLTRYRERFGDERMLVLIYDDFRADNEATVRRVLRFLDVDETVPVRPREANPTVRVRSQRADAAIRSLYRGRGPLAKGARAAGAVVPARVRRGLMRTVRRRLVYGKPVEVDRELTLQMRRRYRDEVVALSEYLGRDLVAEWGYEGLG